MRNKNVPFTTAVILVVAFFCSFALAQSAVDYEKALTSFNQEKYDEAYIHLKNALKDNPSHLQSKLMMADILLRRKNPHAAIIEFEESLELGADADIVLFSLAKAYTWVNDYEKVILLETDSLNNKNKFEVTLLQAIAFENLDQPEKAQQTHLQAYDILPSSIKANNSLARYYLRLGMLEKSQDLVTKALSIDTESADSLHIQGQIKERQGNIEQALTFFQKANQLSPIDAFISRSLANAYVDLKQNDKARQVVSEILAITPDEPFIMLLNARLHSLDNNNELAIKAYEELSQKLALIPNELLIEQTELLFLSGLASYMTGNFESARNKLISYITQKPDNLYAIELLVDTHSRLNEHKKALIVMEKHYQAIKDNLSLSMTLCDLYLSNNKPHKCYFLISELKQSHPKAIRIFNLMEVKILQARGKYQEALAFFEKHFSDLHGLEVKKTAAILYMQNRKIDQAQGVVEQLISLEPENIAHLLLKVEILIYRQEFNDAQEINDSILAATKDIFAPLYNQAYLQYLKQEYKQAQRSAKALLPLYVKHVKVHILLGNILIALDKLSEAEESFKSAKLFDRDNVLPYEKLVHIYRKLDDLPAALKQLDRLQKSHFLEPKYILIRAEIYLQQRNMEGAAAQFKKLSNLWGDNAQQLLFVGQKQRLAKLYPDAEKTLSLTLRLSSDYLFAKIELMRLYMDMKQFDKAQKLVSSLSKQQQNNPNIQVILGDIALSQDKLDHAKTHFSKAIELDNNYHVAIVKLYQLATQNDVGAESFLKTINAIIAKHPEAHLHRHILADFLYDQGDINKATEHYYQLIKIDNLPKKEFIFNNLANILIESDITSALNFIDKAMASPQPNSTFIDTKGWILTLQGNYIEGLDLLREANSMNANNPSILYHIGYNLVKVGQIESAKIELKKALSAKTTFAERKLAQTLVNSI